MLAHLPYRVKIALLTLIPLILAISAIAAATALQTKQLAETQAAVFESELLASKKAELGNYMELAHSAVSTVYRNPGVDIKHAQQEAYDMLKSMEFGEDGYFFVYDYQGINIAHPRKPELEGKDLLNFQDDNGKFLIQELIAQAKQGGGFTRYLWDKPSGGVSVEKLGYSIGLDDWQWMIGTGLYLDDIEEGVININEKAQATTRNTLLLTGLIATSATLAVAMIGFLINLSEGKLASNKMRELTHKTVNYQEDERRRVSRELHDGINQLLVSVRYKLDKAKSRLDLRSDTDRVDDNLVADIIDEADDILTTGMQEVRRISRDLRPTILDDLGLSAAVESLANDFSERTGIDVKMDNCCRKERLPQGIETAFFRIIQEAFTNIEKHAKSTRQVALTMQRVKKQVSLTITNNGLGFEKSTLDQTNPERGQGLRNMKERVELLEGQMSVVSSLQKGTTVSVSIPL